jgi:hypothetical protein
MSRAFTPGWLPAAAGLAGQLAPVATPEAAALPAQTAAASGSAAAGRAAAAAGR